MAALISIAMCGQLVGQAVYGAAFDILETASGRCFWPRPQPHSSWSCAQSVRSVGWRAASEAGSFPDKTAELYITTVLCYNKPAMKRESILRGGTI